MVKELIRQSGFEKFKGFVWAPGSGAVITTAFLLFALSLTLYLSTQRQDIRQQAAPGARSAVIKFEPRNSNYRVGESFEAKLLIDGLGQEFDSVKATILVSDNLLVENLSIVPASQDGCNLTFADDNTTPTKSSLSFHGISPRKGISECILYVVTAKALREGPAAFTITNASVISSGKDQNDILRSTLNGVYMIYE